MNAAVISIAPQTRPPTRMAMAAPDSRTDETASTALMDVPSPARRYYTLRRCIFRRTIYKKVAHLIELHRDFPVSLHLFITAKDVSLPLSKSAWTNDPHPLRQVPSSLAAGDLASGA